MNIERDLEALKLLSVGQLQRRYAELFGEPTNARHRQWLIKRILWRTQANSEGGLSDRARQRAQQLAREADLRLSPPKSNAEGLGVHKVPLLSLGVSSRRLPPTGTVLIRNYKGREVQVKVLEGAFEYNGTTFNSLSAVAKEITGTHCNGYHFFRLPKAGGGA